MDAKNKIIVALDVKSPKEASALVEQLTGHVGGFKVGLEFVSAYGAPEVLKLIPGNSFFDGKFDDTPNTVAEASKAIVSLGADMFDVHVSAGKESLKAAVANKKNAKVLGVTVLTTITDEESRQIFGDTAAKKVAEFTRIAQEAGCDGVVCSAKDLQETSLRKNFPGMLFVTPGIRPSWATAGDQKRIATPAQAVLAGADYLIIGRPITKPPLEIGSPLNAVKMIQKEIAEALEGI
jgi:orotidine-5'-phosphate decarboxylase